MDVPNFSPPTQHPSFHLQHTLIPGVLFVPKDLCTDSYNIWASVKKRVIPKLKREVQRKKVIHKLHKYLSPSTE